MGVRDVCPYSHCLPQRRAILSVASKVAGRQGHAEHQTHTSPHRGEWGYSHAVLTHQTYLLKWLLPPAMRHRTWEGTQHFPSTQSQQACDRSYCNPYLSQLSGERDHQVSGLCKASCMRRKDRGQSVPHGMCLGNLSATATPLSLSGHWTIVGVGTSISFLYFFNLILQMYTVSSLSRALVYAP